jgi:hypothetical protein
MYINGIADNYNLVENTYNAGNLTYENPNSYERGYNEIISSGISRGSNVNNSYNLGSITAPDILSIINGDNAFEIKEGDTLPTLKVFNN